MRVLDAHQSHLKDLLVGGRRLLNDVKLTRKLMEINQEFDESSETLVTHGLELSAYTGVVCVVIAVLYFMLTLQLCS